MIPLPSLHPLAGTAIPGSWMIGTADGDQADGRLAIFPILKRLTPTSIGLIGTGFYLQPKGGFATAAHVAQEAQELIATNPDSVGIADTLPNGSIKFRPIWKFFMHETADVAFGIPRYEFVDDKTGMAYRAKVLSLTTTQPAIESIISTWSYPLHQVVGDAATGQLIHLQPDFYDGALQEFYAERGPSVKLRPPYYRTNIHLHGGSSGGPVFNGAGDVFGVASSSFEGEPDLAFVTPASALLEIEIPEIITDQTESGNKISLQCLANIKKILAK
ncbi:S1 family peptidase [Acidiphilium acidophilum]|uniref:Serine protease n=1 Tax=Acidiphilium acidophilum TaxID=76588 RepID=A0AAW9DKL7_ACIAO|nr:serine protease [Acidiphilium acidophilum]MDX5929531.1 serine protease [Acidiphilium acidophilum]